MTGKTTTINNTGRTQTATELHVVAETQKITTTAKEAIQETNTGMVVTRASTEFSSCKSHGKGQWGTVTLTGTTTAIIRAEVLKTQIMLNTKKDLQCLGEQNNEANGHAMQNSKNTTMTAKTHVRT